MTTATDRDAIRTCYFRPYLKGKGPTFKLIVWDANHSDHLGKSVLGYELRQSRMNPKTGLTKGTLSLFTGEDFACSPLHAIDSDECIKAIMGFLTLRPGDTDSEYFDDYTEAQLEYCGEHAESLQGEIYARFGDD